MVVFWAGYSLRRDASCARKEILCNFSKTSIILRFILSNDLGNSFSLKFFSHETQRAGDSIDRSFSSTFSIVHQLIEYLFHYKRVLQALPLFYSRRCWRPGPRDAISKPAIKLKPKDCLDFQYKSTILAYVKIAKVD